MSKLVRWGTSFTDNRYPSVGLIISSKADGVDLVKAVVAPFGLNEYPKYVVSFGNVIAFTCMEESFSPERDFDPSMFEEGNLCAYEYIDSPWLKSYEEGIDVLPGGRGPFHHYLIFGGDNNVEVITRNIPKVDRVEQKTQLVIEHEI